MVKSVTIPSQKIRHQYRAVITKRNDYVNADGSSSLVLRVRINGVKKDFTHQVSVLPSEWDETKKKLNIDYRKRVGVSEFNDTNLLLARELKYANEIFMEYRIKNEVLTTAAFAYEYKNPFDKEDFVHFMKDKIRNRYKTKQITDET